MVKMARKIRKILNGKIFGFKIWFILIILLLALMVNGTVTVPKVQAVLQGQSIAEGQGFYLTPAFGSIVCNEKIGDVKLLEFQVEEGTITEVFCDDEAQYQSAIQKIDTRQTIDSAVGPMCKVSATDWSKPTGSRKMWVCDDRSYNKEQCQQQGGDEWFGIIRDRQVPKGGKAIIETKKHIFTNPQTNIKLTADIYGLDVIDSNGRRNYNIIGCSIEGLARDVSQDTWAKIMNDPAYHGAGNILLPRQTVNWVGGSEVRYDDGHIISGSVVGVSGEIYVVAPNKYYKVFSDRTIGGYRVVDSSVLHHSDILVCIPNSVGCNSDGTVFTDLSGTGMECSPTRGVAPGWYPSSKDPNEVCTLSCAEGQTTEANCKTIPQCEEGIELLNANYECVKVGVPPPEITKTEGGFWDQFLDALSRLFPNLDWKTIKYVGYIIIAIIALLVIGALTGGRGRVGRVSPYAPGGRGRPLIIVAG